jgi:hypothetical protein
MWERSTVPRLVDKKANLNSNNLFVYVKKTDNPDILIQRVGGNAGKASTDVASKSESSNYFVKLHKIYTDVENNGGKIVNHNSRFKKVQTIVDRLNTIVFDVKDDTVGPRSISKKELNSEVDKMFPKP